MNVMLKIEMVLISVSTLAIIIHTLKKKSISIKYSILWMLLPVFFLFMSLFSTFMIKVANMLGFELLSNMIFFITVGILFVISFSLTIIVTNLNKKVVHLAQEIATLKSDKEGN